MTNPLCIYHANCADGFAAAWVVRHALGDGNVDFHAAQYGQEPPDPCGRDIVLVDFSFKRPVLDEIGRYARSILVLDHHKTAQEDLAGLPIPPGGWTQWMDHVAIYEAQGHIEGKRPLMHALFDMDRSGAGLAWDYFFAGEKRPRLIDHVEDRDLWRFHLPLTRDIQACVVSHPFDFKTWDWLVSRADNVLAVQEMAAEGAAIDRKLQQDIASILATPPRRMKIAGVEVAVVNAPGMWASDMAGTLAKTEPFGAIYFDTPTGRVFSLRSRGDDGADVSAIAKSYGGGGHKNAAGFQVPLGWEGSPRIKTEHVYPPIPVRSCDWSAWYDGYEEGGPSGSGSTEAEAIRDLIENQAAPG